VKDVNVTRGMDEGIAPENEGFGRDEQDDILLSRSYN
jgi:hypothetical protein